jgi:hypothetical protein
MCRVIASGQLTIPDRLDKIARVVVAAVTLRWSFFEISPEPCVQKTRGAYRADCMGLFAWDIERFS